VDPDLLQSYKLDPDSYQGHADLDRDPDPAFHPDADADPDPMRINADLDPLFESYFSVLYINFSRQFIEKSIKLPHWPDPDLH
jgi:hypothetical protein